MSAPKRGVAEDQPADARATAAVDPLALLEREAALAAVRETLAAADEERGGLLLVCGPAGIGKSSLAGWTRRAALADRIAVLWASCGELERKLGWGVVLELFGGGLAGLAPSARKRLLASLPGPVSALLDAARVPPEGDDSERLLPLLHGLFRLTEALSERSPLLLAVDDVQWCDPASLQFLLYLLPRLEELAVAVVLTARTDEPDSSPELDRIRTHSATRELALKPLGVRSVARLVRAEFPTAQDDACRGCAELTGGNPYLVRETLRALRAESTARPPTLAGVRALAPATVARSVLLRLARLPAQASALCRALSVLGDEAALRHAAGLAGLEAGAAAEAAATLSRAHILRACEPLSFVHPLVRQAIYGDLPATTRSDMHLAAARLLEADGAEHGRVAVHLGRAAPRGDVWVVDTLCRAARVARAWGTLETAVDYLERALAEPPPSGQRAGVLVELGRAEAALVRPGAPDRLAAALELIEDPPERARVAGLRGRALHAIGRGPEAAAQFQLALADAGDADGPLARELASDYLTVATFDSRLRADAFARVEPVLRPMPAGETAAERALLARIALRAGEAPEPCTQTLELASRAWADGALLRDEGADGSSWVLIGWARALAGDQEGFAAVASAVREAARSAASPAAFATASLWVGWANWRRGKITDALADLQQSVDAARLGWGAYPAQAPATMANVLTERGELEAAEATIAPAIEDPRHAHSLELAFLLESRARLAEARGQREQALADYREAGRLLTDEFDAPWSVIPWRARAALLAHQLGDADRAQTLLAEETKLCRHVGAAVPLGRALRVAGLMQSGERAIAGLREAVEVLERAPAGLELTLTLIDFGAAMRRANQRAAARDPLRRALELADQGGAIALAERARIELAATGIKAARQTRHGRDGLTPSELRVAEMAAQGMTNQAIAQDLFVTRKAVEWHLGNTYRKLDIRGRPHLAKALDDAA